MSPFRPQLLWSLSYVDLVLTKKNETSSHHAKCFRSLLQEFEQLFQMHPVTLLQVLLL